MFLSLFSPLDHKIFKVKYSIWNWEYIQFIVVEFEFVFDNITDTNRVFLNTFIKKEYEKDYDLNIDKEEAREGY